MVVCCIASKVNIILQVLLEVLYSTGVRRMEVVNLNRADVHTDRGVLTEDELLTTLSEEKMEDETIECYCC